MTGKGQHTPGPWRNDGMKLGRSPEHRFWEIVGGDPERLIGQARTYSDARLIAAAPRTLAERDTLLEALRELLWHHDAMLCACSSFAEEPPKVRQARAAIRLAEGDERE